MKRIAIRCIAAAVLLGVTASSQAGIIAELLLHHKLAAASAPGAASSVVANPALAAVPAVATAPVAGVPNAAGMFALAEKTHAAAAAVVQGHLDRQKGCAAMTAAGQLKGTMEQYKCILVGAPAMLAALAAKSAPTTVVTK